jgi:hypothetical protein
VRDFEFLLPRGDLIPTNHLDQEGGRMFVFVFETLVCVDCARRFSTVAPGSVPRALNTSQDAAEVREEAGQL